MPQRRGGEPFGPQRRFRVAWIVEVEKLGDALAAALGGRRDPPTPRHSRMALERRGQWEIRIFIHGGFSSDRHVSFLGD